MRQILPLLAAALLPIVLTAAEPAPAVPPRYEIRADHDPNGTGKFYLGREIAQVMGHRAADWLERPEREEEEQTEKMVDALKFREGEIVADIGVGSGYVARKIAKRIGASGIIYGVDIQQEMLAVLAKRMAMFRITNVRPVLGTVTDPKLPPASCDTMILVDVYHEFDHPYEMVAAMTRGLKPGGRLVLVEFRGEDPSIPIKTIHKMTEAQVKKEMAVHPLDFAENISMLPWQHVLIFRKRADSAATDDCCVAPTSRAALLQRPAAQ
jgi:ubiquinone/menaquinone biosynthesis C-methylase UbiE